MNIDKFGRFQKFGSIAKGARGEGFKLTQEGDYDMQKKRLKNLNNTLAEMSDNDAITKYYVDKEILTLIKKMKEFEVYVGAINGEMNENIFNFGHVIEKLRRDITYFTEILRETESVNENNLTIIQKKLEDLQYLVDTIIDTTHNAEEDDEEEGASSE